MAKTITRNNKSRSGQRKKASASKLTASSEAKRLSALLRSLSSDLDLTEDKDVNESIALLGNGKYVSFLKRASSAGSQLYAENPMMYYRTHYQFANFLKRYPFKDPSVDRKVAAYTKFQQGERRCRRVNAVIDGLRAGREPKNGRRLRDLEAVKREFQDLIGPFRADYLGEFCRHGPGSGVGVSGNNTSLMEKLRQTVTCTPSCLPYLASALASHDHFRTAILGSEEPREGYVSACPTWVAGITWPELLRQELVNKCQWVHYNNIAFAPKNALTDRTIGMEPTGNMLVQLAVGEYLQLRLLSAGVSLQVGQTVNQMRARQGSLAFGNPDVTLDIKNASGTFSRALAAYLMDDSPWYSFLDAIRSKKWQLKSGLPGQEEPIEETYECFVSMGNGYCFPLESLVFLACVRAAERRNGSPFTGIVYGDDIICKQSDALTLIEILSSCGFQTNRDKSFVTGSFRESCGADYYEGTNVRPLFLSNRNVSVPVADNIATWYWLYPYINDTRRRGLNTLRSALLQLVPEERRFYRPSHLRAQGDSAIDEHLDVCMSSPNVRWNRRIQNWDYREVITLPVVDTTTLYSSEVEMAGALSGATPLVIGNSGSPRPNLRKRSKHVTRWFCGD